MFLSFILKVQLDVAYLPLLTTDTDQGMRTCHMRDTVCNIRFGMIPGCSSRPAASGSLAEYLMSHEVEALSVVFYYKTKYVNVFIIERKKTIVLPLELHLKFSFSLQTSKRACLCPRLTDS